MMRWKELLFTAFYSGYFPVAPGTVGTLIAMGIYILEYIFFGSYSWMINLLFVAVLIYPAIRLGDAGEEFFGEKDPSEVVLDEVMGYWISVLFYPFNWTIALLAFFIFRAMDIIKPYPTRRLQRLSGGLGVMMDDYVAGVYTNILLLIVVVVSYCLGSPIY
jgi:phosphatidylglycerophosphatase A